MAMYLLEHDAPFGAREVIDAIAGEPSASSGPAHRGGRVPRGARRAPPGAAVALRAGFADHDVEAFVLPTTPLPAVRQRPPGEDDRRRRRPDPPPLPDLRPQHRPGERRGAAGRCPCPGPDRRRAAGWAWSSSAAAPGPTTWCSRSARRSRPRGARCRACVVGAAASLPRSSRSCWARRSSPAARSTSGRSRAYRSCDWRTALAGSTRHSCRRPSSRELLYAAASSPARRLAQRRFDGALLLEFVDAPTLTHDAGRGRPGDRRDRG